jgi:hypothetical protein
VSGLLAIDEGEQDDAYTAIKPATMYMKPFADPVTAFSCCTSGPRVGVVDLAVHITERGMMQAMAMMG